MQSESIAGIIPINKPSGISSSRIVLSVKKSLGFKKVGHSGTLDPRARGVLVILAGGATKIVPYIKFWDKEYEVCARLGVSTDTDDLEGEVEENVLVPRLELSRIRDALEGFRGTFMQLPPRYSAKKFMGKPHYEYARKGVDLERIRSEVTVKRIELLDYRHPDIVFKVVCSSGTYIRSLCRDLGKTLGSCAVMADLVRTRNGPFRIEEASALEDLVGRGIAGGFVKKIVPQYFQYPELRLDLEAGQIARNGGDVLKKHFRDPRISQALRKGDLLSLTDAKGEVAGIFRCVLDKEDFADSGQNSCVLKAKRIFN